MNIRQGAAAAVGIAIGAALVAFVWPLKLDWVIRPSPSEAQAYHLGPLITVVGVTLILLVTTALLLILADRRAES